MVEEVCRNNHIDCIRWYHSINYFSGRKSASNYCWWDQRSVCRNFFFTTFKRTLNKFGLIVDDCGGKRDRNWETKKYLNRRIKIKVNIATMWQKNQLMCVYYYTTSVAMALSCDILKKKICYPHLNTKKNFYHGINRKGTD